MLKSIVNRSSKRNNNEVNAPTNESAAPIQRRKFTPIVRNYRSMKKAFSLILNSIDSERGHVPDDTEMYEFVRNTTSEENISTLHRSEVNIAGGAMSTQLRRRPRFMTVSCSTASSPKCRSIQRTISVFKKKFISHRNEYAHSVENDGYLVVQRVDSELVVTASNNIDIQATQHAQPCVNEEINADNIDLDQIQFMPTIPITPDQLLLQQPFLGASIIPFDNHSNNELEAQLTRSSVECGVPQADLESVHDVFMSETTSPSSTNSSSYEYTGFDRPILDDIEYVRVQHIDFEHITMKEIDISRKLRLLQREFNLSEEDELEFIRSYDDVKQRNLDLKKEYKQLKEKHDRIFLPWACNICSLENEPFNVTKRLVCDGCESPGPIKQLRLIQ